MNTKASTFLLSLFLLVGLSSFTIPNTHSNWEPLGSRKVNFKVDRDAIMVGVADGRFKRLKVVVTQGDLNMRSMIVHYGNGTIDNIPLRFNFNKRSTSRVVDLKGNTRIIKKVVFVYDTKNRERKRAKVTLFGKR